MSTTQIEQQAIEIAEKELQEARAQLETQLDEYKDAVKEHCNTVMAFKHRRRFWIE